MFGDSKVEIAPYKILQAVDDQNIEIRQYDRLVLVSTPMTNEKNRNSAFRNLFKYITGENSGAAEIAMTAHVLMDREKTTQGVDIPMTAPVFMDDESKEGLMSFVLPEEYTIDTAPKPTNPDVTLSELKNHIVATIRFSGRLTQKNIQKHKDMLEAWMAENNIKATGEYKAAGYNAPFTIPALRRNEVLIPISGF